MNSATLPFNVADGLDPLLMKNVPITDVESAAETRQDPPAAHSILPPVIETPMLLAPTDTETPVADVDLIVLFDRLDDTF